MVERLLNVMRSPNGRQQSRDQIAVHSELNLSSSSLVFKIILPPLTPNLVDFSELGQAL